MDLEKAANQAVLDGVAAYERRQGWQGHLRNTLESGGSAEDYRDPDWDMPITAGGYVHAVVTDVSYRTATVKFAGYTALLSSPEIAWTGHKLAQDILRAGDIVYVKVVELGPGRSAKALLEQDTGAQGALLAIENSTGDIKAMVGGRDFQQSKFNRATQAQRQVGSSFKPFIYSAAVDRGAGPDDMILDAPATFLSGGVPYTPHNYDHRFEGNITLRRALADSRNIPAVKLAERIGMPAVIDYTRRFGITSSIPAYLPVALGAADLTLYEQTAAYAVFPNDGLRLEPRYIRKVTDYEGHVLEENFPEAKDVTSARTARIMVSLLQGVVLRGTGVAAAKLNHPLAGKTGTTNDFTDAWFIGFSPSITCGVWLGFDEKKGLGPRETGGEAALPIWIDFMRAAISDPARRNESFLPPLDEGKSVLKKASLTMPGHPGTEAH